MTPQDNPWSWTLTTAIAGYAAIVATMALLVSLGNLA